MGVKDLWKILEPSGRHINPETLRGQILAVGAFILSSFCVNRYIYVLSPLRYPFAFLFTNRC